MENPVVSIISPTYRHAAVIAQCIESVQSQSYPLWEQWIIDDDSDDSTLPIAQRYADHDPRIHVLSQTHKGIDGLAETYNIALARSSGALVAILEGDDYWPPHKLSHQVSAHAKDPALVLSHGHTIIVHDGAIVGTYRHPPENGRASTETYLRWALLKRSSIMPVSTMIMRSALERIGGFQQPAEFAAVDYPTWLRLFTLDGHVLFSEDTWGYWRQSVAQVTQTQGIALAETALKIALQVFEELPTARQEAVNLSPHQIFTEHFRSTLSDSYLGGLRAALQYRDSTTARHCIRQLLQHGDGKRKAQALVGIACLGLHVDMEWIFATDHRLMGRQ